MARPESHRVQHPHAGVVLCVVVHGFGPSIGVGWIEILIWYMVKGGGLMEMDIV